MPETISCPKCDKKLRVPEESLGKLAQCPACQFTFTAERPSYEPKLPPSQPVGVARIEEEQPPPPQPRRGWFDEVRRKRDEREAQQATGGDLNFLDDESGARPHRGASVVTLGVLGIVLSCIPLLGGTLGLIATAMASSDLQDMARRRMDRSGKSITKTGQVCGVIAILLNISITFYACMGGFRR
jgi:hypothetical protein